MEKEIFPREELLSSILRTEQQVVGSIWDKVPPSSRLAFDFIENAFLNGIDVSSYNFWESHKQTIRTSLRGLRAKLRQTFVEDAFADLIKNVNTNNSPALLFEKESGNSEEHTLLDAYKFEIESIKNIVTNVENQARQDIISNIVKPDPLAKAGLQHPDILIQGALITDVNNDSRIIITPTVMPGIMLRFNHPMGEITPIVQLVPIQAA